MRRAAILTILAVAAIGVATGASAHTTAGASHATTKLRLKADPGGAKRYNKKRLHAAAGKVTIRLKNPGSAGIPHAIEIEGHGVEKESAIAQPGHRVTVKARLKAGRYEFYCPVGDHKAAGMKGTLIVG
jgi:plastocyanin